MVFYVVLRNTVGLGYMGVLLVGLATDLGVSLESLALSREK